MAKVALTGDIRRPMLTLHGTLDALLPIRTDSNVYQRMIDRRDRSSLHRYYRIAGGTHVDGLKAEYGDRVRPILPCARRAFVRMVHWVAFDSRPPASRRIPCAPAAYDETNRCSLE